MFCVKCHARSIFFIIIINNIIVDHHHQLRIYTIHKSLFHSIIIWFIISTLSPINLQPTTTTTTTTLNQLIPTRNTLENQSKHDSVFASVSVSRYCSCSRSVSVCGMRVYRVRTRLRRHRLPAQRGVRHHQRLVQLQSARRQGLRQLSDLQAQERLRQQPGEPLLVVVG